MRATFGFLLIWSCVACSNTARGISHIDSVKTSDKFLGGSCLGTMWSPTDYTLEHIRRGDQELMILKKCTNGRDSRKPNCRAVASLKLPVLIEGQRVAFGLLGCSEEGHWDSAIIAVVTDPVGEPRPHVERAWRAMPEKAVFQEIPSEGIQCGGQND